MYTEEIKSLFGKKKMTIPNFNRAIKELSHEKQQRWIEKVIITSLCHFTEKGITMQAFLRTFMKSYRQEYLNYMVKHTLLGENRYQLSDTRTFQKITAFMEKENTVACRRNLGFRLQLSFEFDPPVTIDTQCNQMMNEVVQAEDLWEWYQRLTISD